MWDEGVIVELDVMLEYATSKDDSRHTSLLDFKGSDYHSKGRFSQNHPIFNDSSE